jgi:hypothetical protein
MKIKELEEHLKINPKNSWLDDVSYFKGAGQLKNFKLEMSYGDYPILYKKDGDMYSYLVIDEHKTPMMLVQLQEYKPNVFQFKRVERSKNTNTAKMAITFLGEWIKNKKCAVFSDDVMSGAGLNFWKKLETNTTLGKLGIYDRKLNKRYLLSQVGNSYTSDGRPIVLPEDDNEEYTDKNGEIQTDNGYRFFYMLTYDPNVYGLVENYFRFGDIKKKFYIFEDSVNSDF